jgi:NitT/TauT family transport system substrate-binding protein
MNRTSFIKVLLLSLLFIALLAACAQQPDTVENPAVPEEFNVDTPLQEVTLKIAIMPYLSNTVFLIAQEEGFFAEQGLNIEFVQFTNTADIVPMILADEIDAGAPGLNAGLFNAAARDGDFKVILPLTDFKVKECASIGYVARAEDVEAGIWADKQSWTEADLVISMQALNGIPGFVLAKALEGSGVTIDDMNIAIVDVPAQQEALRTGQVDIVYAIEPNITRLTADGDIVLLDSAEQYAPGLAASVITVGPKIYADPDVANRFAIAYLKAVRQFLQGATPANVQYAAELSALDPALIEQICWSDISPTGSLNIDSINEYQAFLLQRGLVDEAVDLNSFIDTSFAEYAVTVLDQ